MLSTVCSKQGVLTVFKLFQIDFFFVLVEKFRNKFGNVNN